MNNKLALIKQYLVLGDMNSALDLLIQQDYFGNTDIEGFLFHNNDYYDKCELLFTGTGGSGIAKPNYTSITSFYFAAMGYDVIKLGSRKNKGISGSTDFFEYIGSSNFLFKTGKLRYSDINSCFFWYKYRNLLSINNSFNEYFNKHILNPVEATLKVAFVRNEPYLGWYNNQEQFLKPSKLISITSMCNNKNIDDAGSGVVYVNGKVFRDLGNATINIVSSEKVMEENLRLLKGDKNSDYSEFLINNMAVTLSAIKGIPFEEALKECKEWYRSKIVLTNLTSSSAIIK